MFFYCGIRQSVCDWLALVANAACADKPAHIRHNAVDAVSMAAPTIVSVAQSSRTQGDTFNTLALRFESLTSFSVFIYCIKSYLIARANMRNRQILSDLC